MTDTDSINTSRSNSPEVTRKSPSIGPVGLVATLVNVLLATCPFRFASSAH